MRLRRLSLRAGSEAGDEASAATARDAPLLALPPGVGLAAALDFALTGSDLPDGAPDDAVVEAEISVSGSGGEGSERLTLRRRRDHARAPELRRDGRDDETVVGEARVAEALERALGAPPAALRVALVAPVAAVRESLVAGEAARRAVVSSHLVAGAALDLVARVATALADVQVEQADDLDALRSASQRVTSLLAPEEEEPLGPAELAERRRELLEEIERCDALVEQAREGERELLALAEEERERRREEASHEDAARRLRELEGREGEIESARRELEAARRAESVASRVEAALPPRAVLDELDEARRRREEAEEVVREATAARDEARAELERALEHADELSGAEGELARLEELANRLVDLDGARAAARRARSARAELESSLAEARGREKEAASEVARLEAAVESARAGASGIDPAEHEALRERAQSAARNLAMRRQLTELSEAKREAVKAHARMRIRFEREGESERDGAAGTCTREDLDAAAELAEQLTRDVLALRHELGPVAHGDEERLVQEDREAREALAATGDAPRALAEAGAALDRARERQIEAAHGVSEIEGRLQPLVEAEREARAIVDRLVGDVPDGLRTPEAVEAAIEALERRRGTLHEERRAAETALESAEREREAAVARHERAAAREGSSRERLDAERGELHDALRDGGFASIEEHRDAQRDASRREELDVAISSHERELDAVRRRIAVPAVREAPGERDRVVRHDLDQLESLLRVVPAARADAEARIDEVLHALRSSDEAADEVERLGERVASRSERVRALERVASLVAGGEDDSFETWLVDAWSDDWRIFTAQRLRELSGGLRDLVSVAPGASDVAEAARALRADWSVVDVESAHSSAGARRPEDLDPAELEELALAAGLAIVDAASAASGVVPGTLLVDGAHVERLPAARREHARRVMTNGGKRLVLHETEAHGWAPVAGRATAPTRANPDAGRTEPTADRAEPTEGRSKATKKKAASGRRRRAKRDAAAR